MQVAVPHLCPCTYAAHEAGPRTGAGACPGRHGHTLRPHTGRGALWDVLHPRKVRRIPPASLHPPRVGRKDRRRGDRSQESREGRSQGGKGCCCCCCCCWRRRGRGSGQESKAAGRPRRDGGTSSSAARDDDDGDGRGDSHASARWSAASNVWGASHGRIWSSSPASRPQQPVCSSSPSISPSPSHAGTSSPHARTPSSSSSAHAGTPSTCPSARAAWIWSPSSSQLSSASAADVYAFPATPITTHITAQPSVLQPPVL